MPITYQDLFNMTNFVGILGLAICLAVNSCILISLTLSFFKWMKKYLKQAKIDKRRRIWLDQQIKA